MSTSNSFLRDLTEAQYQEWLNLTNMERAEITDRIDNRDANPMEITQWLSRLADPTQNVVS